MAVKQRKVAIMGYRSVGEFAERAPAAAACVRPADEDPFVA